MISDLAARLWSVQENWLTQREVEALRDRAASSSMKRAGVGSNANKRIEEEIRRDEIRWLESSTTNPGERELLARFESLRNELNRELFAGLESFEAHFAHYPPGAFYKRHVDRFRQDDTRTVSAVVYLSQDWKTGDGGELKLYLPGGSSEVVPPRPGTLALFVSDSVEHEVLPTEVDRWSIACWFKRRSPRPI